MAELAHSTFLRAISLASIVLNTLMEKSREREKIENAQYEHSIHLKSLIVEKSIGAHKFIAFAIGRQHNDRSMMSKCVGKHLFELDSMK